jgi:RNA polymerase sigma factor (sigma-70 family)
LTDARNEGNNAGMRGDTRDGTAKGSRARETPELGQEPGPSEDRPPNPRHEGPDDHELIARLLKGDENAMRQLVDRYDRLVRYTIFKVGRRYCDRDPSWLDARANEAWAGIVSSFRRAAKSGPPANVPSYIAQISRNKCLDAAKKADSRQVIPFESQLDEDRGVEVAADANFDPVLMLEGVEELEALRDCMSRLNSDDRVLCGEIELIMEKRWREAAERLEIAESTLRSRWRGVLGKLKSCLEKKIEKSLAPDERSTDY